MVCDGGQQAERHSVSSSTVSACSVGLRCIADCPLIVMDSLTNTISRRRWMDRLTWQCDKLSVVSIAIVLSYRQRSGQSVNVVGELSWLQDADIAMTRRASQAQSVAIGGRSVQSEHV